MISLKGKYCLITGASRGLGRLAALALAKEGCNLILHSRDISHCNEVIEEAKSYGVEAYAVEAEMSDMDSVGKMLEEADKIADIDIVVNNAGLQIAYRTDFLSTPASDYDISFKVNTIAPMMICYHYLSKMKEKNFGRIVNVTSGIDLEPEQAGYSASKAALDKVTKDLASKYKDTDIAINLVDPGWCRTDLGGDKAPNSPESAVTGIVLGCFVDGGVSGNIFRAQEFSGMSIAEAVKKVEE